MIHSMTGFGKAAVKSEYGAVTVEARALNHKFFEASIKLPNGLMQFEDRLKTVIHQKVKRGKVYLNVEVNGQREGAAKVTINRGAALRYNRELGRLKKALRLKGDIRLDQIIMLPGVMVSEVSKMDSRKLMPAVTEALRKALNELVKDRAKEGKALYKDLVKRIENIRKIVSHIDERSAASVLKYRDHLARKVQELTGKKGEVDKGRLEQEVALFAKNCDISEELTRLKSHLSSFSDSLLSGAEVGKKLDFIAQELHREANTVASKSPDFKISKGVIQIKSEIEKIREQVKNIE